MVRAETMGTLGTMYGGSVPAISCINWTCWISWMIQSNKRFSPSRHLLGRAVRRSSKPTDWTPNDQN